MAESINRSFLEAFRAYVEDHRDDVIEMTLRGAPSLRHLTPYPGVVGELILEWADVADIIKPWSSDFNAAADLVTRKPVTIKSHFQKAEMQFTPKKDFMTYKGRQVQTKMNARDYPFARWAMEKMATKIKTQQEFQQIFTGDQVGSPTNAAGIYNGLLTLIADDLAAGTPVLTPIATGALTDNTIIDQIEQMDDSINEEYRTEMMKMFVSPTVFRQYRRAYRAASGYHPGNPDTDAIDEITLDGSTTKLVSCPGMGTSSRILVTPSTNIYYAYDDPSDDSVFEMEQDHRNLDVWCDFWSGVGFLVLDPRVVYVNDQA